MSRMTSTLTDSVAMMTSRIGFRLPTTKADDSGLGHDGDPAMLVRRSGVPWARLAARIRRVGEVDVIDRLPLDVILPKLVDPLVCRIPSYHRVQFAGCAGVGSFDASRLLPIE